MPSEEWGIFFSRISYSSFVKYVFKSSSSRTYDHHRFRIFWNPPPQAVWRNHPETLAMAWKRSSCKASGLEIGCFRIKKNTHWGVPVAVFLQPGPGRLKRLLVQNLVSETVCLLSWPLRNTPYEQLRRFNCLGRHGWSYGNRFEGID